MVLIVLGEMFVMCCAECPRPEEGTLPKVVCIGGKHIQGHWFESEKSSNAHNASTHSREWGLTIVVGFEHGTCGAARIGAAVDSVVSCSCCYGRCSAYFCHSRR